ncbi:MAG TPA: lipid II flippase MurJ, partial [Candidatus Sulfotelmatobacter sp.]|nr:lipid II flippase MurJ [Candidatus Sulfotelmatobacter sp.]
PVTVWIILNATPVTRILYEHGKFLPSDSWITSRILAIYGIGIVPNAVAVVLLRCFFAIEDMVTPLLTELLDLCFYLIAAPILIRYFGIEGLAIARGGSFLIVFAILITVLGWRGLLKFAGLGPFLARTAAATAAMGLIGWLAWQLLEPLFNSGGTMLRLGVISLEFLISTAAYLGTAVLLRLGEARQIIGTVLDLVPGRSDRNGQ